MVQINLPENSKVQKGKYFKDKSGSKNLRKINIYRWDPSTGKNPRIDTYEVARDFSVPISDAAKSVLHDQPRVLPSAINHQPRGLPLRQCAGTRRSVAPRAARRLEKHCTLMYNLYRFVNIMIIIPHSALCLMYIAS